MPKSLKITTKYKPRHSIRFAGVNENEDESITSIKSESTYRYDTEEIMESYTPYHHNQYPIHG